MPRLREVPKAEADPFVQALYKALFGDRDPVAEPGTATGTPGNWWTVFAQSPDTFRHQVEGFRYYRSADRKLSPRLREIAQTRVGWAVGSQFVFSQHCKASRDAGLTEAEIAAIPAWQAAGEFNELERAVLGYTDCLSLDRGRVPDGLFEVLRKHLSEVEIIELTYIAATYMMHAVMCRALRLEYDDVPERITEIAAPGGQSSDVMSMVDEKK